MSKIQDPVFPGVMSAPRISVIVAVYNAVDTLPQCIESVARQTYPDKELIIVDGASNDGSREVLESHDGQIDYWISEPDKGVYNAWNKGLARASGDWICFLGADDYFWEDTVLTRLARALSEVPLSIRLAYGQVMLIDNKDEPMFAVGDPWEKARARFFKGACLPHQGVMHRRSLFEQGGFDESFPIGGDYEIMFRELKAARAVFLPDIIVAAMRQGGLSSHPSGTRQAMMDIRRAQKMHGMAWPSLFWLLAMARVYFRMLLWTMLGESRARRILDVGRKLKGLPPYWTRT